MSEHTKTSWFRAWQRATYGAPDGLDEAIDGTQCICGVALVEGALRCGECGQCPFCATLLGLESDPVCIVCAEFMEREHQQAVTR